jgi:predicted transcriptional regulator
VVTKELQIHVGDSFDTMSRRVIDAWHRAERGEITPANPERHVGFESFEAFARVMTPRRLELLRHVHRQPARSIRALALALGRDYRRVHEDVETLVEGGLLDRDATGLHADYETVRMETLIAL